MTYDELLDIMFKVVDYIVWGLAVVGAIALTAFVGYITYTPEPTTRRVANRCINSACENCQVKPSRFVRHQGVCND